MRISLRIALCVATVFTLTACQALRLPQLMENATREIQHASGLMEDMGGKIDQTNSAMTQMQPALAESVKLREPMESMVAPIQAVAGLEEPMRRVADLGPGMNRLASLKGPMERVADLGPGMDAVGSLGAPMQAVAALGPAMTALAELGAPMRSVADLRQPMLDVAALGPTMGRVADLKPTMDAVAALREPMIAVADLKSTMADVANLKDSMERVAELKQSLKAVADLNSKMDELADAFDTELDIDLTPLYMFGALWLTMIFLAVFIGVRFGMRGPAVK